MQTSPRIFLIGPMGAGKTTIGKRLARKLRLKFVDVDIEIEKRTGVDIPCIFETEGEEGFRKREEDVVDDLTQLDDVVIATGGGAVTRKQNRCALRKRGFVVYLHAPVRVQLHRTARSQNRPLLAAANDRRSMLTELFRKRDPLYREIADLVVESTASHPGAVVDKIMAQLPEHCLRN